MSTSGAEGAPCFADLIAEINSQGLLVCSCYQYEEKKWRAGVREKDKPDRREIFYGISCYGTTLEEALRAALAGFWGDKEQARAWREAGAPVPALGPARAPIAGGTIDTAEWE
jgi:hypothetical protein